MHARAVVAEERLGHERRRLAVAAGDVADDVPGQHHLVGALDQRLRHQVDLALAAGGDLVVVRPRWRSRTRPSAGPSRCGGRPGCRWEGRGSSPGPSRACSPRFGPLDPAPVPGPLDRVDVVERLVPALVEPDVVEDEELQLGGEQAGVGQAGAPHVADGLAGDVPGVAGVVLLGDRVLDVADHRQGRLRRERVDQRRLGLGDDQQVGLVDRPPADDARAVEADPLLERLLGQGVGRDREVLPDAGEVHETEVDRRDLALPDLRQDLFGCHRGMFLIGDESIRYGLSQPSHSFSFRRVAIARAARARRHLSRGGLVFGRRVISAIASRPLKWMIEAIRSWSQETRGSRVRSVSRPSRYDKVRNSPRRSPHYSCHSSSRRGSCFCERDDTLLGRDFEVDLVHLAAPL